MKLEVKGNNNYCASIVKIEKLIELENCDNIQATIIQGNHVIVSKDTQAGDIGVFFPIETSIKPIFLNANNLYRDKTLNFDKTKSGFFELNGRVRCMKLRGFKSEGFFIPHNSLNFLIDDPKKTLSTKVGDEFDHIDDIMICEKYVVKTKNQNTPSKKSKADKKLKRISKMIDNQFHFHIDTGFLAKNMHKIDPDDIISITEKVHGTSAIASYVLCRKKLGIKDKIAKFFGANVNESTYDYIYASRKVIKNKWMEDEKDFAQNKSFNERYKELQVSYKKQKISEFYFYKNNVEIPDELHRKIFPIDADTSFGDSYSLDYFNSFEELEGFREYLIKEFNDTRLVGFYKSDIWKTGFEELKPYLQKGMTIYYEIVGFLEEGAPIQKMKKYIYDYGCAPKKHENYIYRITTTNEDGKVFEWSMLQVIQWCKLNGLKSVPLHYYGYADEFMSSNKMHFNNSKDFRDELLNRIILSFLEKDCLICKNKVPNEGIVLRIENLDIEPYKLKSFNFRKAESESLDEGKENIEDNQIEEES